MSENSSARGKAGARTADGDAPSAAPRRYTRAELARHGGDDPGVPTLIAYGGKVYDVTASFPWAKGRHWGDLRAGRDLTGELKRSIHGEEMLARVPCVGVLED
jgi:predicted heme/steroid binding protein